MSSQHGGLLEEIRVLRRQQDRIKAGLSARIQSLPTDNPDAKPAGEKAQIVNFSAVAATKGHILSPFYYDFRQQYDMLLKIVDSLPLDGIITHLEKIVKNQTTIWKENHYRFHPTVVNSISELLGAPNPDIK